MTFDAIDGLDFILKQESCLNCFTATHLSSRYAVKEELLMADASEKPSIDEASSLGAGMSGGDTLDLAKICMVLPRLDHQLQIVPWEFYNKSNRHALPKIAKWGPKCL